MKNIISDWRYYLFLLYIVVITFMIVSIINNQNKSKKVAYQLFMNECMSKHDESKCIFMWDSKKYRYVLMSSDVQNCNNIKSVKFCKTILEE